MSIVYGLILVIFIAAKECVAIDCYRCNSTSHRECLEKFIKPTTLRPEPCTDVFEARYCIKATGIYNNVIGDQRFCSSQDMGNYCEYIQREGDEREYRSCVYTCDTDACNDAHPTATSWHPLRILSLVFLISVILQFRTVS